MRFFSPHRFISVLAFGFLCTGCNQRTSEDKPAAIPPSQMGELVQQSILHLLGEAEKKGGAIDKVTEIYGAALLKSYYETTGFMPVWSKSKQWRPIKDSLIQYIYSCERDGLFPNAYHFDSLQALISTIDMDSMQMQPPVAWAKADLLLTDAFMHIIEDLKHGRLHTDSLSWKYDKHRREMFFKKHLDALSNGSSIAAMLQQLQPTCREYQELKTALPHFLDTMHRLTYTYLYYPFKDSSLFYKKLVARIKEEGMIDSFPAQPDSSAYVKLVSSYQTFKGMPVNGKLTPGLVNRLNNTDLEKLKRIAITLDRYKQRSASVPDKYVTVNLPGYYLEVWVKDALVMQSKVIIGKPNTPTPLISSAISDLVIYPTWTVPNSIIRKEILPALKRNPGYLARKGLALFDYNGDLVDPFAVQWAKYDKAIPYLVRQGSGDDNALGVIKFNFKNPFSVYLHDTNQRYLFKNKNRSLSHGCVRVQDWEKLAFFIVRNDSMLSKRPDSLKLSTDSITAWIARKQKHVVGIHNRLPLFIGYYTCVAKNGNIIFYEDVYNKDKTAREKYLAFK